MAASKSLRCVLLALLLWPVIAATQVAKLPPAPPASGFLAGIRDLLKGTQSTIGGVFDAGIDTIFRPWLFDPAAQWALPMPAGPTYRPKHPFDTPILNESRTIVDEMLGNQYRDVFFQNALRRSRGFADRAAAYARACDRHHFESAAEELARLHLATQQRQEHLDELARRLHSGVTSLRGAFDRARGSDTPGEAMVGTGGTEIFFAASQSGLDVLADVIDKRPPELRTAMRSGWHRRLNLNRMPASRLGRLTRLSGRALGVVNTVSNLVELGIASEQAMVMMALIPHMAEWEALATYLEGLSEQYGRLIATQKGLLDTLEGQFDEAACQQHCKKPAVVPPPAKPAATEAPRKPPSAGPPPPPKPVRPTVRPARPKKPPGGA